MMKEIVKRAVYLQFYGTVQFSCQKVQNFQLKSEQIIGVVLTANTKHRIGQSLRDISHMWH
jgi:hypothetical protein